MAIVPVQSYFEGDFVLNMVPLNSDDTMDVVAEKMAFHSVNRRVEKQDRPMAVRFKGEVVSPETTVEEAGIVHMDYVEAFYQ